MPNIEANDQHDADGQNSAVVAVRTSIADLKMNKKMRNKKKKM